MPKLKICPLLFPTALLLSVKMVEAGTLPTEKDLINMGTCHGEACAVWNGASSSGGQCGLITKDG